MMNNLQSSPQYAVTRLAATIPPSKHILRKFKTLRLDALRSDPDSFLPTFDHEVTFNDEEWARRIADPTSHHFICEYVGHHPSGGKTHELGRSTSGESEWVGMFTLRGPLPHDQHSPEGGQGPPLRSDRETRWAFVGLYIQSEHRGTEVNTAIHEALLDHLRVWTDDMLSSEWDEQTGLERSKTARVAGALFSQDPTLRGLYQALGAYETGVATRPEVLKMIGSDERIDGHAEEERFVAMELVIDC